ncbi:hypothetical protein [Polynucleobacter sp. AP-Nickl1-40-C4]|uniref:hypothetical protein n=1 Tax=Polynucleobacter sp. AP-Nickl1-40-C4 TaxID=3108275 RepID=UPI002B2278E3|nr:hypothetical protein [Polynucleobacter sp. AP-Nickl1-40-C4]MEA9567703.1 hypothetical protein [Polynucleobacter sp. AP-Nickl1-40-C4]
MKLHPSITNREFKLLIKPKGLDRHGRILLLSEQIVKFCKKSKVDFFHLDNANTGLRNIYFYDTPGEDFRLNNIILRVRESRQNVWVDDYAESHSSIEPMTWSMRPNLIQPHKRK